MTAEARIGGLQIPAEVLPASDLSEGPGDFCDVHPAIVLGRVDEMWQEAKARISRVAAEIEDHTGGAGEL